MTPSKNYRQHPRRIIEGIPLAIEKSNAVTKIRTRVARVRSVMRFHCASREQLRQSVHWAGCTLRDCLPSNLIAHYEFHYESEDA